MSSVIRTVDGLEEGMPGSPLIDSLRASCAFITKAIEKRLRATPESLEHGEGRVLVIGSQRSRTISSTILRRLGYEVVEAETLAPLPLEDGRSYDLLLLDTEAQIRLHQVRLRWPAAKVICTGSLEEIQELEGVEGTWLLPYPFSYLSLAAVVKEALTEAA